LGIEVKGKRARIGNGKVTFLNTAYSGLLSQAVVDAGHEWLEARARQKYLVPPMLEMTDETRRRECRREQSEASARTFA